MEKEIYDGEVVNETAVMHHGSVPDHPGSFLTNLVNVEPEKAIELMEKRVDLLKKFKVIALKATNRNDWVDLGGKPFLCASGVDKMASVLGFSHVIIDYEKTFSTDTKGQFYIYTASVRVFHPLLGSKDNVGSATQRDPFFAKSGGEWKSSEDINEGNIKKKAMTNAISRGVNSLLGSKNLTWDEIETYYKGGAGASVTYGTENKKTDKNNNGSSAKKKLFNAILNKHKTKSWNTACAEDLKKMSEFTTDKGEVRFKDDVDHLTEPWAYKIFKANFEN